MRLRAILLLAFAVSLLDGVWARPAADPRPPHDTMMAVGWMNPISPGDTNCPVATHDLRSCQSLPPGHYLVIDKIKGWAKKEPLWANVIGVLDLDACAPYKLIRVRRLARTTLTPLPCE